MKTIRVDIEGELPMLMHSQRAMNLKAEPLARELSMLNKKRGKSDDERARLSELEFRLGLYWSETEKRVYVPTWNVIRCIQDGGKKLKMGKKIIEGIRIDPSYIEIPLIYPGYKEVRSVDDLVARGELWDIRTVKVTGVVERTRPRFDTWGLSVRLLLDGDVMNVSDVQSCVDKAGRYYGLGDYRVGTEKGGQYGTFTGTVTEVKEN